MIFYSVSPEYFGYNLVRLQTVSNTLAIGKKGASSGFVHVMRGCVTRLKRAGVRLRLKAVRGSNDAESLQSSHCHRQREPATVQSDQQATHDTVSVLKHSKSFDCPELVTSLQYS
jgi:hypothetical protein